MRSNQTEYRKVGITVSLDPLLVDEIDKRRGRVSRSAIVEEAIKGYLKREATKRKRRRKS